MSKNRTMRKDRVASFVRLLVLGCVLCITLVTLLGQQKRLSYLNEEQKLLSAKLENLKLEEEKRKRLLDFTQTDAYIEQFARDKLGLVKKDDIKFVAPTPTVAPAAAADNPPVYAEETPLPQKQGSQTPSVDATPSPAPQSNESG